MSFAPLTIACGGGTTVAPRYAGDGKMIDNTTLPLAMAEYAFHAPSRAKLAPALVERLMQRAGQLLLEGREHQGIATLRIGSMLLRVHALPPTSLSDASVLAFDRAVGGPAARSEEGASFGIYTLWSQARPADDRPRSHLDAIETWRSIAPGRARLALLPDVARAARFRVDALAYSATSTDRVQSDESLLEWMRRAEAAREEGARYRSDAEIDAITSARTAGIRLIASHLRDGDVTGAARSIPDGTLFIPERMRGSLSTAADDPTPANLSELASALLPFGRTEGLEVDVADSVFGLSLVGSAKPSPLPALTELGARGLLLAGLGDVTPAIVARGLLGTRESPRDASSAELGRGLSIAAAALKDLADQGELLLSRRAFAESTPLLTASAGRDVTPSASVVQTLMGLIEAENGRPDLAGKLFEEALTNDPNPAAYLGRARLLARRDLPAALRSASQAKVALGAVKEGALASDVALWTADFARRSGDNVLARSEYVEALRLLVTLRSTLKGPGAAEIGRRMGYVLSRFAGAEALEEEVMSRAEAIGGLDRRVVMRFALQRGLRALRSVDASRARRMFRGAQDHGLSAAELTLVAIVARAVSVRASVPPDREVIRTLEVAAAHDDHDSAGALPAAWSKHALGTISAAEVLAVARRLSSSGTGTHIASSLLAIAMVSWAKKVPSPELDVLCTGDFGLTFESTLALELADSAHAELAGTVTTRDVPGL